MIPLNCPAHSANFLDRSGCDLKPCREKWPCLMLARTSFLNPVHTQSDLPPHAEVSEYSKQNLSQTQ